MATLILQPDAAAGIDDSIVSSSPDNGHGTRGEILVDAFGASQYRGLIKFDLSSLPANVDITSAVLTLVCHNVDNNDSDDINIYRSLVEWFEGDSNGVPPSGDGSTWNFRNANGSVAWAGGAGGGSGSDFDGTATDITAVTTTGTYTWDVTADVQDFAGGVSTNHGWWLIGSGVETRKFFRSSDWTTASERPELEIIYTLPLDIDVADAVAVNDFIDIAIVDDFIYAINIADVISVVETAIAVIDNYNLSVNDAVAITDTAAVYPIYWSISETDSIAVADGATVLTENLVVSFSDGISVGESITFEIISPFSIASRVAVEPAPLLYITDGTLKSNGQLNRLNLIDEHAGYCLEEWNPAIAQYKAGGYFADSPQATGRRLVRRVFANTVEVMLLHLRGNDQNAAIRYQQDLLRWLEQAADYRQSDWTTRPVYLVARSGYESNTRYAIIEVASVPELSANVYHQPFLARGSGSYIPELTLRIERSHWTSTPPGQAEEVPVSSFRSYTVTGWS